VASIPPNLESKSGASPPFSGSSFPILGLKPPFDLLVKGVECPVKNKGESFVKGIDSLFREK